MIPIAAVLLLLVLAFTIAVVVSNPEIFDLSVFGARISVNTAGVYFTGAGAMLVVIVAAALMRRGVKRELTRRAEVKALRSAAGVRALPKATQSHSTPKPMATASGAAGSTAREGPDRRDPNRGGATRAEPDSPSEPRQHASTLDLESEPENTTTAAERHAPMEGAQDLTGDSDR